MGDREGTTPSEYRDLVNKRLDAAYATMTSALGREGRMAGAAEFMSAVLDAAMWYEGRAAGAGRDELEELDRIASGTNGMLTRSQVLLERYMGWLRKNDPELYEAERSSVQWPDGD